MAAPYQARLALRSHYAKDTEVRVSALMNPGNPSFDPFATVVIESGACWLQEYATPAELDALAAMLTKAAALIREHEAASIKPLPVPEVTELDEVPA